MTSVSPGDAAAYASAQAQGFTSQTAEFFLSNYRLGKTLGIGSFGKVKVAEHILTGHKVAIKILNRKKIKQMDMEEKVRREIKILRLFMHPHIIRLYEVVETPNDIYVVMEYVKAGELFDYIVEKGRLLEDEARHFFQQIISGVEYCHRNMVVHRDLKPENLLLDSKMNVKIADFGLSNVMRDGHFLKTSCGSPNYAAPEVISGRLYAGPEVDVWSCGVILYALLCGSLPFDDENIPNLFKKIKGGIYTLPSHLSPGARDLIPRMLLVDPLSRITIPEIRQHPWFTMHLPRYLAVMQADPVAASSHVDEDIVREVVRLGFTRDFVVDSLKARQQNKASVAYYLMADNRRRMPSSAYLKEEMTEATDGALQYPSGIMGSDGGHVSASCLPPLRCFSPRTSSTHPLSGAGMMATSRSNTSLQPAKRLVVERRWRLGLSSRAHPSSIMQELYRTLQYCGVAWKKNGPYNLKCRAVLRLQLAEADVEGGADGAANGGAAAAAAPGGGMERRLSGAGSDDSMAMADSPQSLAAGAEQGPLALAAADDDARSTAAAAPSSSGSGESAEKEVKFEAQLYKMRDGEYSLDFQRLSGDLFLFMDTCSSLLSVLRL